MTDLFPFTIVDAPWISLLALFLDLWLGDPDLPWRHPVVLIGKMLSALETPCRSICARFPGQEYWLGRLAGGVALLLLTVTVALVTRLLIAVPVLGGCIALYLAWAGLAMGSLLRTGTVVLSEIEDATLPEGRRALSMLVSRETGSMDRAYLRKTLADTMTENFTDALTAPFFWLVVTGPVGLWIYKAVSTTDSMWGYRTPEWRYLGFCGARGDDLLAFLPARLSILLVAATDWLVRTFFPSLRTWRGSLPGISALHTEAWGMPSPNSGCSMAVFAWLLNANMAGPSVYFGELVDKPWLGPGTNAFTWNRSLLEDLYSCMELSSLFGMLLLFLGAYAITLIVSVV